MSGSAANDGIRFTSPMGDVRVRVAAAFGAVEAQAQRLDSGAQVFHHSSAFLGVGKRPTPRHLVNRFHRDDYKESQARQKALHRSDKKVEKNLPSARPEDGKWKDGA
jgi:hypothetical protein